MSKIKNRLTSWSYSRLAVYKQCPAKAKYKFIDKLPEEEGPALERGNTVHKALQDFVEGKIKLVPKSLNLTRHIDQMKAFRAEYKHGKIKCEEQWAWNRKWQEVDWFAKDAWLRVKMDLCVDRGPAAFGIDHKTGKYRPGEYTEQLVQYCVCMLLKYPKADEAIMHLRFWDVDAPDCRMVLNRKYLAKAIDKLEKSVEAMFADTKFAPTPNGLCGWCSFSKKKGGPCKIA